VSKQQRLAKKQRRTWWRRFHAFIHAAHQKGLGQLQRDMATMTNPTDEVVIGTLRAGLSRGK